MEVLLWSLYGTTAVMAVPRRSSHWPNPRWHGGSFEHVQSFRRATAKVRDLSFPRCYGDQYRKHGEHGSATAVYAEQPPQ